MSNNTKIEILSNVENGQLKRNRKLLQDAIKQHEGKTVIITIQRLYKKRSNQQLRYLFGVCYTIIQHELKEVGTLLSVEQIHDLMKFMFLKVDMVNEKSGEVCTRLKSTSELNTVEMIEFIQNVRDWGESFLSVFIPEPDLNWWENKVEKVK